MFRAASAPERFLARGFARMLAHCEPSTYSIEIVDCLREPIRTLQDGVLVTPTLIRLEPKPGRTIVGTLSDSKQVVEALGIDGPATMELR